VSTAALLAPPPAEQHPVVRAALALMDARPGSIAAVLHPLVGTTVAHEALVVVAPGCPASPVDLWAGPALEDRLAGVEWWRVLADDADGRPAPAELEIADDLFAHAWTATAGPKRLAIVLVSRRPLGVAPAADRELRALAALAAARLAQAGREAAPDDLAASRAVAAERERVTRELQQRFSQSLSTILLTLRGAGPQPAPQVRAAIDVASQALVALRDSARHEIAPGATLLGEAWAPVASDARRLGTATGLAVELALDGAVDLEVPAPVAHAARQVTCAAVLNVVAHADARRLRVTWRHDTDALSVAVADDGRGFSAGRADGGGLRGMRDRVASLGGSLAVDTTPGWGTRITARLPLAPPSSAPLDGGAGRLLASLGEREREVLALLTDGRRNREIAGELFLSEHTVKFHVANILQKLGVRSRSEAVAVAVAGGLRSRG